MEEQLDIIVKKLDDMESQMNELRTDNKTLSEQMGKHFRRKQEVRQTI